MLVDYEMSKLKKGDHETWHLAGTVYRRQFVIWAVNKLNAKKEDAEDAYGDAIEVLLKVLNSGKLAEFKKDMRTFILSIAYKKLIDIFRCNNKHAKICKALPFINEKAEDGSLSAADELNSVLNAKIKIFNNLPANEREFILLCFKNEKLSMKAIAAMSELKSECCASVKKYRILKKLGKMMRNMKSGAEKRKMKLVNAKRGDTAGRK